MTDNEITIKALKEILELVLCEGDLQRASTISHTIDLINCLTDQLNSAINGQETLQKYVAEKDKEINRLQQNLKEAHIDIKERLAEIERLSKVRCHFPNDNYCKVVEVNEENEILKEENKGLIFQLKTAKSEAYKECIEKVKEIDCSFYVEEYYLNGEMYSRFRTDIFNSKLDNLLKEMVGEGK